MKRKRFLSLSLAIIISLMVSCSGFPFSEVEVTTIPLPLVSDTAIPLLQVDKTASPSTPTPTVEVPVITKTTAPSPVGGTKFYVSPNGTSKGDGSINDPWDLQTALDHPSMILPGDTIYLRGGSYGSGGSTTFKSRLAGAPDRYITVRPYPGEHVVIDGGFWVGVVPCAECDPIGGWVIFQELEVMNSDSDRVTGISGSHPEDIYRVDGFNVFAPHSKLINNVVHDTRQGFGFWSEALDSELYGNIVFNNGWEGPDRGHGHGIYAQNERGTKAISDNVVFNNFGGFGIHIYSEGGLLSGFYLEGNINFNGSLLAGGLLPTEKISATANFTYKSNAIFGYASKDNQDLMLENNYFGGPLNVNWWQELDIRNNVLWSEEPYIIAFLYSQNPKSYLWNNNAYYVPDDRNAFSLANANTSWDQWKKQTRFDQNSSLIIGPPPGVDVFVRPNQYDNKRAHIIVYNWDLVDTVAVDLSSTGLEYGDSYVIRNIQNYHDEAITGIYNGQPISIPMESWTIAMPIGRNKPLYPSTFPQFGVFLLTVN